MQYCGLFSVLVLGYTLCFKLTGPREWALPSTENTCLLTLARGHLLEVDFSETFLITSAENNISEPANLKISWGRIPPHPPTRLVPSALAIMPPPPPRYKSPSYGPVIIIGTLMAQVPE